MGDDCDDGDDGSEEKEKVIWKTQAANCSPGKTPVPPFSLALYQLGAYTHFVGLHSSSQRRLPQAHHRFSNNN